MSFSRADLEAPNVIEYPDARDPLLVGTAKPKLSYYQLTLLSTRYNYSLNFSIATLLALLKLAQAAGQVLFGMQKTLEQYHIDQNDPAIEMLLVTVIFNNVLINAATRVNPIYNYFLPPKIYKLKNKSELSSRITDGHIFFDDEPDYFYKAKGAYYPLVKIIQTSSADEQDDMFGTFRDSISTYENRIYSQSLDPRGSELFDKFKRHKIEQTSYDTGVVDIFYRVSLIDVFASTIFSAMSAFLSAYTLMMFFFPGLQMTWLSLCACTVMMGSIVSYLNFNLSKMREGVKAFADSFQEYWNDELIIPVRAMSITLPAVFFGVLSGLGMSYLTTTHSIEVMPFVKDLPPEVKLVLVILGLITGLANQVFGFSYSTFKLFKGYFPEEIKQLDIIEIDEQPNPNNLRVIVTEMVAGDKNYSKVSSGILFNSATSTYYYFNLEAKRDQDAVVLLGGVSTHEQAKVYQPKVPEQFPLYAVVLMGVDAFANSLGGFIGSGLLLTDVMGPQVPPAIGQAIFCSAFMLLIGLEYLVHREKNGNTLYANQRIASAVLTITLLIATALLFNDTNPLASNPDIIINLIWVVSAINLIDNFFLSFGFGITGSEKAIRWVEEKTHYYTENYAGIFCCENVSGITNSTTVEQLDAVTNPLLLHAS